MPDINPTPSPTPPVATPDPIGATPPVSSTPASEPAPTMPAPTPTPEPVVPTPTPTSSPEVAPSSTSPYAPMPNEPTPAPASTPTPPTSPTELSGSRSPDQSVGAPSDIWADTPIGGAQPPAENAPASTAPAEGQPEQHKGPLWIIILAVLIIILVAFIGYLYLAPSGSPATTTAVLTGQETTVPGGETSVPETTVETSAVPSF